MLRTCGILFITLVVVATTTSVGAQTPNHKPLIMQNIERMVQHLGLDQYITIQGINAKGDKVFALPKSGMDLHEVMKADRDFVPDPFGFFFTQRWGHPGCWKSYRLRDNPSLQVTLFRSEAGDVYVELDIDRFGARWLKPLSTVRHFKEVATHWLSRKIRRKTILTSQKNIQRLLDRKYE